MNRRGFLGLLARAIATTLAAPAMPRIVFSDGATRTALPWDEICLATEKWFAPAVIDQIFSQNPLAGRLKEMSNA